jgi:hypothetical protein
VKDPATVLVNEAVAGLVNTGAACAEPTRAIPRPKSRTVPRDPAKQADINAEKAEKAEKIIKNLVVLKDVKSKIFQLISIYCKSN